MPSALPMASVVTLKGEFNLNYEEMLKRPAYTHGGVFHADDVFAAAFLRCINPDMTFIRVKQPTSLPDNREDYIIFDIGGGAFDHHTKESMENRPDITYPNGHVAKGAPYASFGKIARALYPFLMTEREYEQIDRTLIVDIDCQDALGGIPGKYNTLTPNQLSMAISSFNPQWNESIDADSCFEEAVGFASRILTRYIMKATAMVESQTVVEAAEAERKPDEHFVVLPRYVNYNAYLSAEVAWVIYPSLRGGFQLYSRVGPGGKNIDLFTPEEVDTLKQRPGCMFAHPGGFTAVFTTLAGAVEVAKERSVMLEQLKNKGDTE